MMTPRTGGWLPAGTQLGYGVLFAGFLVWAFSRYEAGPDVAGSFSLLMLD
jgi:hypothetical protein